MWYLIDVARIDGFSGDGIDGLADVEVRLAARVYAQQLAGTVAEELVACNMHLIAPLGVLRQHLHLLLCGELHGADRVGFG